MKNIEEKVLKRLQSGKSITHLQCINWWHSYKLASYVHRLRLKKVKIVTEDVTQKGVRFGRYWLNSIPK